MMTNRYVSISLYFLQQHNTNKIKVYNVYITVKNSIKTNAAPVIADPPKTYKSHVNNKKIETSTGTKKKGTNNSLYLI